MMVRPASKTRHSRAAKHSAGDPALFVEREDVQLSEAGAQLPLDFEAPVTAANAESPLESAPGSGRVGAPMLPEDGDAASQPALATVTSVMGADGWFDRAVQLEERGDLEEAAAAYENALEEGGPSAEVAFNLGNVLHSLGRPEEAITRYEVALELDSEYVEAWNNLASVHAELENWDEAIGAGRSALALAPEYPDTHYNLAEAYFASGRLKDARRHGRIYLSYDYSSEWAKRLRWKLGLSHR
jgi:tetratricopeptide (TPR) repeat protein